MAINDQTPYRLAIAGDGFGWGSVGLLAALMHVIRLRHKDLTFVGLDTDIGRPVLGRQAVEKWIHTSTLDDHGLARVLEQQGVRAAVVVLNALLASRLESIGCPVVYVDTMPFLWTEHEFIPRNATRYCAQLCSALPRPCWPVLRGIEALRWVGGIVGPTPRIASARVPGKAVLTVGGLQSPVSTTGSVSAYLQLVLNPVLRAFRDRGFHHVVVAGNLEVHQLPIDVEAAHGLTLTGGRMERDEFVRELSSADMIATSPGLTTMLEISAMGQRAIILPPQNLSQMMFASEVANLVDSRIVLSWPSIVMDQNVIVRERERGEEAAIQAIYNHITAASAAWPKGLPQLVDDSIAALAYASALEITLAPLGAAFGNGGAGDVVDVLDEVLREGVVPSPV